MQNIPQAAALFMLETINSVKPSDAPAVHYPQPAIDWTFQPLEVSFRLPDGEWQSKIVTTEKAFNRLHNKLCRQLAAVRVKKAVRTVAGSIESNKLRGMSRAWFARKTVFAGALGAI
jgi:hypothetical protein